MKIAVVGSHGTGKTTLCRGIAKSLSFNYIPDVARDAFRLKFLINEATPPETQLWILTKQIELERNTPEHWVIEKSLWDNIVYGQFSITDKQVVDVIRKVVDTNAKYDLVFYLPIQFPLVNDGVRSMNKNFQKNIDRSLRRELQKRGIKYIELRGDIKEILQKALMIIKGKI